LKLSEFDPKAPSIRDRPLILEDDHADAFLNELEETSNFLDKQRAKYRSIAKIELLPE
jgi:hypothetical protein